MIASPILLALASLTSAPALAAGGLTVDAGVSARRFEQQVKSKVGDPAGERLVEEFELGLALQGAWRFLPWLSAGLYVHAEHGERNAARFKEFEPDTSKTVTEGAVGGGYSELWIGPYVRGEWRWLFAELGYGAFGMRRDDARDDLPDEDGGDDEALRTDPRIAWLLQFGAQIEVAPSWHAFARLRYRVRYYDRRGDKNLPGTMEHGTQDFTPFIGIGWRMAPDSD